jgi:hypothetical protein
MYFLFYERERERETERDRVCVCIVQFYFKLPFICTIVVATLLVLCPLSKLFLFVVLCVFGVLESQREIYIYRDVCVCVCTWKVMAVYLLP